MFLPVTSRGCYKKFIYSLKYIVYFMFPPGCTANPIWPLEEWRTSPWTWPSLTLETTPTTPISTSTSPERFSTSTTGRRCVVAPKESLVYLLRCSCLFLKSDGGDLRLKWYTQRYFTHTYQLNIVRFPTEMYIFSEMVYLKRLMMCQELSLNSEAQKKTDLHEVKALTGL